MKRTKMGNGTRRLAEFLPESLRHSLRQCRHRVARTLGATTSLRVLSPTSAAATGSPASKRINELFSKNSDRRYLEIGVANGETLEAVEASDRTGVDPWPLFATSDLPLGLTFFRTRSDNFFAQLPDSARFGGVLLDGLHEFRQTYRDLVESLARLDEDGFVLIDDTVPADEIAAMPDQKAAIQRSHELGLAFPRPWMGDVYKVVFMLHACHPDLDYWTYIDQGRHQTVVWRYSGERDRLMTPEAALAAAGDLQFNPSWVKDLPAWFHPAAESDILQFRHT